MYPPYSALASIDPIARSQLVRASRQPDLPGKVCVVTGISSGIGRSLARALAERGATVVAVARGAARGRGAVAEVEEATGSRPTFLIADLASQASIRALAAEIEARFPAVHVLVNNAGSILPERRITADRVEEIFAVNHLGPFLLTRLLEGALAKGALAKGEPSRVVHVASEAHRRGAIDFDDPMLARSWSSVRAYCNAKLATVMCAFEHARRLGGARVTVNAVHPGAVATAWGDRGSLPVRLAWKIARPFFLRPDEGARGPLHVATSPDLEGVTGRYFVREREREPARASLDREAALRLFRLSDELTGLA